jgi:hypothetical protein
VLSVVTLAAVLIALFKPTGPARPISGLHTYSVNAQVQIERDGSTGICTDFRYASYPAQRCPVTVPLQIDVTTVPQAETLRDGTIWTPILELKGTWTGKSLVVTSHPKRATKMTPLGRPGLDSGNAPNSPTESMLQYQQRLLADDASLRERGIWILESGWSKAGFYVILAAGDRSAIDYVKRTYQADVVSSWFRLVN